MVDARHTAAPDTLFWDPDDKAGLESFLAAHDIRHRTYRNAAALLRVTLQPCLLTGKMDGDWYARHMLCHLAMKSMFPAEVGELNVALEMPTPGDQNAIYSWMRRHALVHARLDIAYGIK